MGLLSRGTNLTTARAYVKERFRPAGWERLAARLPVAEAAH
jgi:hypothetical protein